MNQRLRTMFLFAVMTALSLSGAQPAQAVMKDALSLEILVNGQPLRELAARNSTYVEAVKNAEYSLRLSNRTDRRMAVALAVDGLNTIDAKTGSASKASKWVLDPWETVTIEGWQIGPDAARRFFFTSEDKSYGAWLGRPPTSVSLKPWPTAEYVPCPHRRNPFSSGRRKSRRGCARASHRRRSRQARQRPRRPTALTMTWPPPASVGRSTIG